jgi:large subunit ribosomal protein L17
MRHRNQRHKLGVSASHRKATLASLACALIEHGRIKTTLAKAKALRPFIERNITYAKKAQPLQTRVEKYNYKQLALAKLRDEDMVDKLFQEWVGEFMERNGGYTRIYKTGARRGDAAEMALIEFVKGDDAGYEKRRKSGAKKSQKKAAAPAATADTSGEEPIESRTEAAADSATATAEASEESASEGSSEEVPGEEPAAKAEEPLKGGDGAEPRDEAQPEDEPKK